MKRFLFNQSKTYSKETFETKCHGEIRISQVAYWAGRIWNLLSTTAVYFIYDF